MTSSSFAPGQAVRLAGLAKMATLNGTPGLVLASARGDPPGTVKVRLRTGMEAVVKPANLVLAPAEPAPAARPRSPPAARRASPRRQIAPEQAQENLQRALTAAAAAAARKLQPAASPALSSTAPTPWLSALMSSQVGERPAPTVEDFAAGQTVKLVGLVKMAHMNGTRGTVLALGTGATGDIAGTVKVKLKSGSEVALKPEKPGGAVRGARRRWGPPRGAGRAAAGPGPGRRGLGPEGGGGPRGAAGRYGEPGAAELRRAGDSPEQVGQMDGRGRRGPAGAAAATRRAAAAARLRVAAPIRRRISRAASGGCGPAPPAAAACGEGYLMSSASPPSPLPSPIPALPHLPPCSCGHAVDGGHLVVVV
ncbi:unnamed protein product [Prorocentrum cordatum]|uniref:RNA helicase n=1 Tax=Prorocentrum cordatum TaxID=2364126 RepID=A0ABN9PLE5_9DINO|nr:unnamed protein product [Polarella glacialis]